VADVVKYCVELYEYQVQQKNQSISLQTIPAFVNGDREKLWRVFSNLINNAIKFSREGGVIIVTMQVHDSNVIIAVHDHGIGIPENFKSRIFSSPETSNRQGTSGEASFGLGLSISRQIITLHHGKIWFESMPGQGASFYVSLPLTQDQ
jgi:signal transduction histidine kinase